MDDLTLIASLSDAHQDIQDPDSTDALVRNCTRHVIDSLPALLALAREALAATDIIEDMADMACAFKPYGTSCPDAQGSVCLPCRSRAALQKWEEK